MNEYLQGKNLTVGYGKTIVLEGVDFTVSKGEIMTLVGPNGCGKSTLLKSITGQLKAMSGSVLYEDMELSHLDAKTLSKKLALVLTQRIHPERYSCFDVVATGRYPYTGPFGWLSDEDKEMIRQSMEAVHVWDLRMQPFEQISDGQRQRVMLARAICQQPEVLVLDEPTSYLDIRYKMEFLWLLRKLAQDKKIAVVAALHEIDLAAKISDTMICIKNQRVDRMGAPEEILDSSYVEKLYEITDGHFNSLYGSAEFPRVTGKPQVFVIGGGGTGVSLYRKLQKQGIAFAAGILQANDLEYPIARELASELISVNAYSLPTQEEMQSAKALIEQVEQVICTLPEFSYCNSYNQELLEYGKKLNKISVYYEK